MTFDDLLIDKRTVRRNIEKGRLDKAAYRQLLEQLPDLSGKVYRAEPAAVPAVESPRVEAPAEDRAAASPAVPPYQPLSPG